MSCRICGRPELVQVLDLGAAPPSNAYRTGEQLSQPEKSYPLSVSVCPECWLLQLPASLDREQIFDENYAYFSSFSSSWLAHAERYVEMVVARFGLTASSSVIEIASNDGYLLQYFQRRKIPCLGIEPTASTASAAREKGIETLVEFFGASLAGALRGRFPAGCALLVANNVLAHVPDLNDFAAGIRLILGDHGVATFEFPHLERLLSENQFDTIYHEHFSYFALAAAQRLFKRHDLKIFDVEQLPTHGGSLRVFVCREENPMPVSGSVSELIRKEESAGLFQLATYGDFQLRVERVKAELLTFLADHKKAGRTVAGYGAAAKGNTLLNYCGVTPELLPFVVDASPWKIGKYLPGSKIPIVPREQLLALRPDFIFILPWNLVEEIREQLSIASEWGGKFVTAIPALRIL